MNHDKIGIVVVYEVCPLCGNKDEGTIVMNTKLTKEYANEVKSLHKKAVGIANKPCKECQDMMAKGFLLIGADMSKTTDIKYPYRTGHIWVIDSGKAKEIFGEENTKLGASFIELEVAEKIGLPINK